MQLDNVNRRWISTLFGLDLAWLLRVLDRNWHEIIRNENLTWEVRNFVKETQAIRNRWAHAGAHPPPEEDTYRDLDTMQRLAQALGDSALAERLGQAKRDLLLKEANTETSPNLQSVQSELTDLHDASKPGIAAQDATPKHHEVEVQTRGQTKTSVDLVLIGCVKTKLEGRHKAKNLFISPLFIGRRARAEAVGAPWFVLSAKFGLLAPDREVDTYDVSLNNASTAERRLWSARVLEQLRDSFGSVAGKTVEVHAGASYRKFGLVQGLKAQGAEVIIPLEHARQGEQLAWYSKQSGKALRDLSPPSRNSAPKVQYAPPSVPSKPSGLVVELLQVKSIQPFNYRWPENVEEFSAGWEMQIRAGGQVHRVRYGIGQRHCFGRNRVHSVTWFDGHPMVEGAEAEDYEVSGDLVSVLKVYGGNRDAKSIEEVDPDYSNFRIERHCEAIHGPMARRGLAVRIGRDDLDSWAHHALLRARSKGVIKRSRRATPKASAADFTTNQDQSTLPKSSDSSRYPSFIVKIGKTYYRQGFFNVPINYESYFAGHGAEISIITPGRSTAIHGHINRTVNSNSTPLIMGTASLRDWFQSHIKLGDMIRVIFHGPNQIELNED